MNDQITKTKQADHIEKAEQLLKSVGIPSHPRIVIEIDKEMSKIQPNLHLITDLVEKDVAMSAKVIKIANSPFFSTRRSDSIEQALLTIGMTNFYNIIVTASLQESVKKYDGTNNLNEKFLKHSSSVAAASRFIANKIRSPLIDMAYMAGLFHDCAVPVFNKRFKDYTEIVDLALGTVPLEALQGVSKSVIGIEDERYSTNHCIAGFMIAKSWLLPDSICEAVCYHHYRHIDIHKDPIVQQLVSLLLLAEVIIHAFDPASIRVPEDVNKWAVLYEEPLSLLGFDADDLADLFEDIYELLSSHADLRC